MRKIGRHLIVSLGEHVAREIEYSDKADGFLLVLFPKNGGKGSEIYVASNVNDQDVCEVARSILRRHERKGEE